VIVLGAPLLPAVVAAVTVSLTVRSGMMLGAVVATLITLVALGLAVASVDRRRLAWLATAFAASAVVAHAAFPVALVPAWLFSLELPRTALARPIAELVPAPESALLLGIVLGERSGVPFDLSRAFATSGTTHLLAISGFNMTLVATAVALALRGRCGPVARSIASVGAIVIYSLLVGLSPSVLRAALMASVAAIGIVSGRRAATANALCAAVIAMLVADPAAIDDVGLQLSALATSGLVLWQGALAERLRLLPAPFRDGIATTLAATAPTLPVVAGAFGRVSLVSPLANLFCVPMFPLLMLAGAATSAIGAVSLELARPVALLAWASAAGLRSAVQTFAGLPLASVAVPEGLPSGVLVAGLEVATVLLVRRVRWTALRTRWSALRAQWTAIRARWMVPRAGATAFRTPAPPRAAVAVVVLLAIAPAIALSVWPTSRSVRVIALDVGQGDAYLVDVGDALALIDGGPDPSRVLDVLGATLAPWQRRIDLIALTHAHTDHGAGLLSVLDRYEVGVAIEPVGLNPSPLTDLWSSALARRHVERRAVRAGQRVTLGSATIEVLAPADDLLVDTPSLVLRVRQGTFSALFTGDAVDDALQRVLDRPELLRARIYVPPHHGADTRYAIALRESARPDAALISVGAGNRYGHPTPQTLAALAGVATYRTDRDGTVEIQLDGTGLVVRTRANGLPPPRRGPLPYPASG
jgi:competence protein ComEC